MEIFKLWGSIFINSDEAEKSISRTEDKAKKFSGGLKDGMKTAAKWGAAVVGGATVAGAAIGALAAPLVKSAANAQAMNAQFEQVFGDMQKDAQTSIDSMGKNFGMLPNRIKPAMSMMTSMFKGLGMDTEEAMATAEEAVTLTADAAAFYDKSFEDANSALNSFIKGNYEGGESIGLFANETQLAKYAADELGIEWKKLDEAGKQVSRLEYAQAMQEAAGATGQAARESGSLENVMGNLRQAWEDAKAKFGEPILEPAIGMIQSLIDKILEVDVDAIVSKFETFVEKAKSAFETVSNTLQSFKDNLNIILPIISAVTGAIIAQLIINSLVTAYNAWKAATVAQTTVQWLLNAALNANPFGLVALAIGVLIGVGVLLWKNWDTIKVKAGELFIAIALKFSEIKNAVVTRVEELKTQAIGKFASLVSEGSSKFASLLSEARSKFSTMKDVILNPINSARDGVKLAIDRIKGFFSGLKLSLPRIKMPSFSIKNWSMNPVDWLQAMPKLTVAWNAAGGVFNRPTIFNTANAGLQGVGEAGPEAILPLNSKVLGGIGRGIADTMGGNNDSAITINLEAPIVLNGREVAKATYKDVSVLINRDIKMKTISLGSYN